MGPNRRRPPRLLVAVAAIVLAVGLLMMLWPVLTNPITADDRYWYLDASGRGGSYAGVVTYHLENLDTTARGFGRVTVLAYIMRSLSMLVVTDLAVWSATPLVAGQALLKLALLGLIVAVCTAFLVLLRHRRADGSLGRLPWRRVALVVLVTTALTAAGAQAHAQFRNGWTSYAVLTWGAVIILVGTVALLLWLARLSARHGGVATVVGVLVALLVAVFLNTSYEMYYVAVPLILVVLVQQPLLDRALDPGWSRERRARLWVGGSFLVGFGALFVAIRLWISALCADRNCYEGSQLDLGPQTVVTAIRNLLTAVPGAARSELAEHLREQGMADQVPGWVTPGSVLLAGLTALAVVVVAHVLSAGDREGSADTVATGGRGDEEERRAQSRLLLLGALVPAAAAVGTALIMALSDQAPELITSVGTPYRSTMVTWTMLALTAGMVVAALQVARPRSSAPRLLAALAVALLASHTLAANYPALRASHVDPGHQAVRAVHREVVLGDPSPEADARRCATLDRAKDELRGQVERRVLAGAQESFRHYHGGTYCSDPPAPEED